MALNYIYLMVIVAWAALFIGFLIEEYTLLALSSLTIMILGVHIAINGLTNVTNLATEGFAFLNIGLGSYVLIRSGIEAIDGFKDNT